MTQFIQNCGDLQIYSGVVFHKTRHRQQAHITSGAPINCVLSVAERRTQMTVELGGCFRWPVLVMAALESHNICCGRTWSSNQSGVRAILALRASSVKFLTRRSMKSQWIYLAPHECNTIQLLSNVRSRRWKNNFWSTWKNVDSLNSCWPYD
jgi:hypothetical protein